MSITEELEHKKVQAVYLRRLLEHVNAEIKQLEHIEQVDPYAELKAAHAAGKRIAWSRGDRKWEITIAPEWNPVYQYKIVDDETFEVNSVIFGKYRTVKYTKCALTGKITAQVAE